MYIWTVKKTKKNKEVPGRLRTKATWSVRSKYRMFLQEGSVCSALQVLSEEVSWSGLWILRTEGLTFLKTRPRPKLVKCTETVGTHCTGKGSLEDEPISRNNWTSKSDVPYMAATQQFMHYRLRAEGVILHMHT